MEVCNPLDFTQNETVFKDLVLIIWESHLDLGLQVVMSFLKICPILQRQPVDANIAPPIPPRPAGNLRTIMRKTEIISISQQPDLNVITDETVSPPSQ